ncbi:hypothetical protein [Stenotrophomonas sp.]|uniref:hypothetical protein n=1 Tax=Stenotrophomonas sp. TaxID=69392 RepID=UPI002D75C643|nr:hypothetical protein [Stenotrophomonas sp.]HYQ23393.1 hypothetical protein [Stenotrophomonas sp.]
MDYPVLAMGDTGQFRVQVPAYAGGQGRVSYAAHALMPGSSEDRGYRFVAVHCEDPGFTPVVHYENRGVVCSRIGQAAHPAFGMVVTVVNTGAADGETLMEEGLRGLVYYVGPSAAPWRIYGVQP